eukprot:CAMPEP_0206278716 /NCGR_PEP_ID=MMETSP0047_2-20121206/37571_1 /ASSEMBLY_ACC=CAM_ASM_000192 /TAXON_ID=195065 /ORGANISM="Chroomonas mesostigmatica_cf, Strain CCMP1168" /LENGTH=59 /DNA_ID=CAMNT_0053708485 /DNA_START=536 /DNA_END=711 /DNA_ORIENTATION=-
MVTLTSSTSSPTSTSHTVEWKASSARMRPVAAESSFASSPCVLAVAAARSSLSMTSRFV